MNQDRFNQMIKYRRQVSKYENSLLTQRNQIKNYINAIERTLELEHFLFRLQRKRH